jgi:hypothetical protein
MKIQPHLLAMPVCSLVLLSSAACGNRNRDEDDSALRMPSPILSAEFDDQSRFVRRVDINLDGVPDVFEFFEVFDDEGERVTDEQLVMSRRYDDMRLAEKHLDTNLDGSVDVVRIYDSVQRLTDEMLDSNFDGRLDYTNVYREGILAERRTDAQADGFDEEIRYYRGGNISRLERDEDGDGRREYYAYFRDNELTHYGINIDGDADVDIWTRRQSANVRRPADTDPAAPADVAEGSAEGSSEAPVDAPQPDMAPVAEGSGVPESSDADTGQTETEAAPEAPAEDSSAEQVAPADEGTADEVAPAEEPTLEGSASE